MFIDKMQKQQDTRYSALRRALETGVLVLDGSLGVQIQRLQLAESEYRGRWFVTHPVPLAGNVDMLCLTAPERVKRIHASYLRAGADIIETNTFNSTTLSQSKYQLGDRVRELNLAGARIAREAVDEFERLDPSRPRFVAGSMGPTAMAASLPNDVNDPSRRAIDFDTLSDAAMQQAEALIEGGVDALLLETCFDALNVKAQLHGIRRATRKLGADIPVFVSLTLSDASGRLLSGHTPEAILSMVESFSPDVVGFNCGAGPESLVSHIRNLAAVSPYRTIFYPNAGLPDRMGRYSQTARSFADAVKPLLEEGLLNIVGGCCGTDDTHIHSVASVVAQAATHLPPAALTPWLAGIDAFYDDRGFINVGERCNVAGSRKFLRLINEKKDDETLAIARSQIENGAMAIDINVDDGMLDSRAEMVHFLRLLGSDPLTSSVPWMIDSSSFDVIRDALRNVPGKPIVNSISLKHGEEEFLAQAAGIREFGAAVVVMAFDERGQADTLERKIEVCARAYRLLVDKAGFSPRDIIFDPNVLTVATGMAEHERYGIDFIEAVRWIKANLPGAKVSGGLSNLSFAFRGNNYIRQAMHAVFLYHAVRAGLDMAIMDPGAKVAYEDIPAPLLKAIEDVILARDPAATERLIAMASDYAGDKAAASPVNVKIRPDDVDERLALALRSGDDSGLEADLEESVGRHGSANAVVEGPLMAGMEHVGKLFEEGKMFLPQVVKSARVMHRAVEILRPLLEAGRAKGATKGTFLMATVKGDVHDIGKNIVSVVLRCNNFEIIDLGVQVEADTIVSETLRLKPDFIGLSGLISPSLDEMGYVADALQRAGIRVPLILGGAATSELHTAVKIAPRYDGIVVRVGDASRNPVVASRILADPEGEAARIAARHEELRASLKPESDDEADPSRIPQTDWSKEEISAPALSGRYVNKDIPLADVRPFINWIYFANCWKTPADSEEGRSLREDAEAVLDELEKEGCAMCAQVEFFSAMADHAAATVTIGDIVISTPRQKPTAARPQCLSLCDFIAPRGYDDHVGVFMVTTGEKIRCKLAETDDEYRRLLMQSLCDRLAEAASEWLHYQVRTRLWGYAPDEPFDPVAIRRGIYRGIRPAVGYSMLPDQAVMHDLARLLPPAEIGVEVTANGALHPASTVAGFYLASPRARYFTL